MNSFELACQTIGAFFENLYNSEEMGPNENDNQKQDPLT
jgi:hypothetical protein